MIAGSVSDPDPFHFGGLKDPCHETDYTDTDQGGKKSAKTMENSHKNQPKSREYRILVNSDITT